MIDRYMPADFEEIWSEENMYRTWLRVELEVCRVLAEKGWIPKESMATIEQKADFSVARIKEIENITHHDLIAFTTSVAEYVGPDSRYIHWGLTSTDVVDTARGLQLKQASEKILAAMDDLRKAIKERAMEHRKDSHDGADARRARGSDDIRAEAGGLVRRNGAESRAHGASRRDGLSSGKFRAPSARLPTWIRTWRRPSASGWD